MSNITKFERRYIDMFLDTGVMILPGSARSDYPNATEEEFVYIQKVHQRLAKLSDFYKDNPIGFPQEGK